MNWKVHLRNTFVCWKVLPLNVAPTVINVYKKNVKAHLVYGNDALASKLYLTAKSSSEEGFVHLLFFPENVNDTSHVKLRTLIINE